MINDNVEGLWGPTMRWQLDRELRQLISPFVSWVLWGSLSSSEVVWGLLSRWQSWESPQSSYTRSNGLSYLLPLLVVTHTMPSTQSPLSTEKGNDAGPVNKQPPPSLAMSTDPNAPGPRAMRLRGGCFVRHLQPECCPNYHYNYLYVL